MTEGYILKAADGKIPIHGTFITVTGPIYADATPVDGGFTVVVPDEIDGRPSRQSYVVLTACKDAINDGMQWPLGLLLSRSPTKR